jgi:hypothetical protein
MPVFVLAYRKQAGYTPTAETTAAWRDWFASMGGHLADLGKPRAPAGRRPADRRPRVPFIPQNPPLTRRGPRRRT